MRLIRRTLIVILGLPVLLWVSWMASVASSHFCWKEMRYLDPKGLCPVAVLNMSKEWRALEVSCDASSSEDAAFQVIISDVNNNSMYQNAIIYYDACGRETKVH